MPAPGLRSCPESALVRRVAALETRVTVKVVSGPDITVLLDPDQSRTNAHQSACERSGSGAGNAGGDASGSKADEFLPSNCPFPGPSMPMNSLFEVKTLGRD